MKLKTCSLLLLSLCTLFPDKAGAEILYRNNFGNNTGQTIVLNNTNIQWKVFRSAVADLDRAMDYSGAIGTSLGISSDAGMPDSIGNVNAPASLSATAGHAFLTTTKTENRKGLFYTEFTLDRAMYTIDSFEWDGVVSLANTEQRVAIRIGGEWFVSEGLAPVVASSFALAVDGARLSLSLNDATWHQLYFVPSQPFEIGTSSVTLPGGNIDAFGLFIEAGMGAANTSRFDNFTVNATAIPEGTSVGMVFSAGGLLLLLGVAKQRAQQSYHCIGG